MALRKVILFPKGLEDSNNPLLGPVLKGLYCFGMWQTGGRLRTIMANLMHFLTFLFFVGQAIDLFMVRNDVNNALNNLSLTALGLTCVAKCLSFAFRQQEWKQLIKGIADEELLQINKQDPLILNLIDGYTQYCRVVTYLYWFLAFATTLLLFLAPYLKYFTSSSYRDEVRNGLEAWPQIFGIWFPFDNTKMPGYCVGVFVQLVMGCQGSGVLANFDANALAIMTYLKGHLTILQAKCVTLFHTDTDVTGQDDILNRIRECHRHHNVLIKHYKTFNSLLSPVMFLYVLVCSVTICCSVVQFRSSGATASQKLWAVQYTIALISQLFLYCWHSNDVAIECSDLDRGIYKSDWWKANIRFRHQILLLGGKFTYQCILVAGPFTNLSVPTFIDILKGSYSFYTLFSQMQDI